MNFDFLLHFTFTFFCLKVQIHLLHSRRLVVSIEKYRPWICKDIKELVRIEYYVPILKGTNFEKSFQCGARERVEALYWRAWKKEMTLIILTHFSTNLPFIKMSLEWFCCQYSLISNTWLYCNTVNIKSDTYLAHL